MSNDLHIADMSTFLDDDQPVMISEAAHNAQMLASALREAGKLTSERDQLAFDLKAKTYECEIANGEIDRITAENVSLNTRRAALPVENEELVGLAWLALEFIEEEADNRAAAGSEMSDYEREPRALAEQLAAAIAKHEGRG